MTVFGDQWRTTCLGRRAQHQPGAPVLEVLALMVRYRGHLALEDVTFELHAGERVAIVGPNGAGKSTLLKAVAGVLVPTAGTVKVYGDSPAGHICIAYLPQRSVVDWGFPVTVSDVVMMGRTGRLGLLRWPGKRDWACVRQCLDMVGIGDLADRQINALSGGQQQRMFIARALAQEAELILMDEPLAGLDVPTQEGVFQLLQELRQGGVTVVVSTHDLNQAAAYFDRVMLLNRRLIGFGTSREVLTAEQLLAAYGGHLRLVELEGGVLALGDTCCEGHEHHG